MITAIINSDVAIGLRMNGREGPIAVLLSNVDRGAIAQTIDAVGDHDVPGIDPGGQRRALALRQADLHGPNDRLAISNDVDE
jgi:hypothetical protein